MSKPIDRPTVVADAHLKWLDSVRRMRITQSEGLNTPVSSGLDFKIDDLSLRFQEMFSLNEKEASVVLSYWMKTFESSWQPIFKARMKILEERSNANETQA